MDWRDKEWSEQRRTGSACEIPDGIDAYSKAELDTHELIDDGAVFGEARGAAERVEDYVSAVESV